MSFGWSLSDIAALSLLCYRTVQNAQKACGEYDSLTQEVTSLHSMFTQLETEKNNPSSVLNAPHDSCREDVEAFLSGCRKDLLILEKLLEKYNSLGAESGGFKKLRHKVRFGNGKMADLPVLRAKISYYNSILHTQLQLVALRSAARVERGLQDQGGELEGIRRAVEGLNLRLVKGDGSPLTPFLDDDVVVWKTFRRELLRAGYSSAMLQKHGERIRGFCQRLVKEEKMARAAASPATTGAAGGEDVTNRAAPDTGGSLSTNSYTPEEVVRDAFTAREKTSERDRDVSPSGGCEAWHERKERMWTEITKDLVTEEAIREKGYEFEETETNWYIMEYLRYDDVLALTEMPPTARTVEPESTLEDVVGGSQSGLFKLPPPAVPFDDDDDDDDDSLAVTGLVPGNELSMFGSKTGDAVSREEPAGFTPSDMLFGSLFNGRSILGATKKPAVSASPDNTARQSDGSSSLAGELSLQSDVSQGSNVQRIWHKGIAT